MNYSLLDVINVPARIILWSVKRETGHGSLIKPAAYAKKELSKMPREAVCSAVSASVRQNFGKKFARP